ncbi:MAG: NAD(+)--rifampin ADP-ribosyltransferase [Ignavibacteriaceae bacterium]|jgi:rifampin ADP-ribosylating transferase
MNQGIPGTTDDLRTKRFYHGTRTELKPGDLIKPGNNLDVDGRDKMTTYVYLTPNLDAAIWEAEIAVGEGSGRVYMVEPIGEVEDVSNLSHQKSQGHPWMSCCSREPLRVMGEITEWQVHSPEALKAMKDALAQLEQLGVEPIDD